MSLAGFQKLPHTPLSIMSPAVWAGGVVEPPVPLGNPPIPHLPEPDPDEPAPIEEPPQPLTVPDQPEIPPPQRLAISYGFLPIRAPRDRPHTGAAGGFYTT